MSRWVFLALVAAMGCTRPPAPKADPKELEAGRSAWRDGCASCHFVPDRSLVSDRVWIEMLETTTCVTAEGGAPTEEVRRGLRAFLPTETPTPWIGPSEKVSATDGTISAPFERGSLYLEPASGAAQKPVRLVWAEQGTFGVSPGEYTLQNFVIERTDAGRTWLLSCTGPGGPSIAVTEGKQARLAIATGIFVTCKASRTTDGVRVSAGLAGHGGMEASLLDLGRDEVDRRVPISFEVLDAAGRAIGEGTLTYG